MIPDRHATFFRCIGAPTLVFALASAPSLARADGSPEGRAAEGASHRGAVRAAAPSPAKARASEGSGLSSAQILGLAGVGGGALLLVAGTYFGLLANSSKD